MVIGKQVGGYAQLHLSIALERTATADVVVGLSTGAIADVGIEYNQVDAWKVGGEV